ncbi:hypothetical protein [Haloactinomyces albus]|uniref:Uncharacterized protein n=1 Tax=Haloactinomyces albus TaxID=1352928 RepID=A0AAE3ZD55_9ACTN|nr:hypothetical protein [Haloactinomyces albus]MDR7301478.1 hypothetical protein [Haloactinomyces albus]
MDVHHVEPLALSSALSGWKFAHGWDLADPAGGARPRHGLMRVRRRAPHQPRPVHRTALFAAGLLSRVPAIFGNWLESARRSAPTATSEAEGTNAGAMASIDDVDEDERAHQTYNAMSARLAGPEEGNPP